MKLVVCLGGNRYQRYSGRVRLEYVESAETMPAEDVELFRVEDFAAFEGPSAS